VHEIEVTARSAAGAEAVWSVLVDSLRWPEWTFVPAACIEREGDPPPFGLGAIRRMGRAPVITREEVTTWEPPQRYGYRLVSGMPMRGYHAEVTLTPDGIGTAVRWRSSFERATVPGTAPLLRWFLRRMLGGFAKNLAKQAERAP
jgi:hypothetical protein